MATRLMSFNKNTNVGLFAFVNNKFALIGREVTKKTADELEKVFEVPVHRISIAGTSLVGVFVVGNDNFILVPSIVFESELKELDRLKIKYKVFKTDQTCLGNNISLSKDGALINPEFTPYEEKELHKLLDVPVKKISIADTETPGSCIVINKHMAIIHRDASIEETKIIENILKVKTVPGTINMGSPYMHSGILCNGKGLIIGDQSGSAEIMNAEEELGFLE